VDPRAIITSVGAAKFVLCEAGTVKECVRVTIPRDALSFRACEAVARASSLTLTCLPAFGTIASTSLP
jgi:hypothetical protein